MDDEFNLEKFAENLINFQEDLGDEFRKVLNENMWELLDDKAVDE